VPLGQIRGSIHSLVERKHDAIGTLAEAVTVTLPCAWIYATIGQHFTTQGAPPANHQYREWLVTYADPGFAAVAD